MSEAGTTPGTATDADLIRRVREGDTAAYADLFDRHVDSARRLSRHLVPGPDADDLVAEAFTRLLALLQDGRGPDESFRAYLLTSIRRLHIDRGRARTRVRPTDDDLVLDTGVEFVDPATTAFENGAAAQAFASLPERWQLVLWHLEVEGQKPAEVAPLLGMTPNGVSALAYRAREGLKQAYLDQHRGTLSTMGCRSVLPLLAGHVRRGLSARDTVKVEKHLDECRACTGMMLELNEVNSSLGALLAPALLGAVGTAYLAGTGTGAAVAGSVGSVGAAAGASGAAAGAGATGAAVGGSGLSGAGLSGAGLSGAGVAAGGGMAGVTGAGLSAGAVAGSGIVGTGAGLGGAATVAAGAAGAAAAAGTSLTAGAVVSGLVVTGVATAAVVAVSTGLQAPVTTAPSPETTQAAPQDPAPGSGGQGSAPGPESSAVPESSAGPETSGAPSSPDDDPTMAAMGDPATPDPSDPDLTEPSPTTDPTAPDTAAPVVLGTSDYAVGAPSVDDQPGLLQRRVDVPLTVVATGRQPDTARVTAQVSFRGSVRFQGIPGGAWDCDASPGDDVSGLSCSTTVDGGSATTFPFLLSGLLPAGTVSVSGPNDPDGSNDSASFAAGLWLPL